MDHNPLTPPLSLPPALLDIHLSLERGGRITLEQARVLIEYEDILTVAAMADAVARRKWSGKAFYASPVRLSLRRFCEAGCTVCDPAGGDPTPEALLEQLVGARAHEVHVLGIPDEARLDDVERFLRLVRARLEDAWIQGFTAGEVRGLADRSALDLDTVAVRLQQAGLDGLLGTHEEVYTRQGRLLLQEDADSMLDVHVAAHRAGLVSVATLRYSPGEPPNELLERMSAIRESQRKTAGFSAFAPLPLHLDVGGDRSETPSGYEDLRMMAVGRLFFDNIPHVRAPWLALGLKMGPVALSFGADDLGWQMLDPHVRAYAPSTSFSSLRVGEVERAVQSAGRCAVQVDGAYRELCLQGSAR